VEQMLTCPVCGERGIGKVGVEQYYCWECCVEFVMKGQDIKIYSVLDDGTLTLYSDQLEAAANHN
jgi:hypothetical protein